MIRTLIVDDEPLALDVMQSLLASHGDIEVLGAYRSATQALKAINRWQPDLLFLDIQMPGMSGFELISKIQRRNQMRWQKPPKAFAPAVSY